MRPYRVCVIGLGRIGHTLQFDRLREQPASHTRTLSSHPRVILGGGCDNDAAKRAAFTRRYPHTLVTATIAELMEQGPWDIVVIAVNESAHLAVCEAVFPHIPALVVLEKPVAPTLEGARAIFELSRRWNVPVQVNHERRFSLDYVFVHDLLKKGYLGRPLTITATMMDQGKAVYPDDRENARGTLLHDGTHLLDAVFFLTGGRMKIESAVPLGLGGDGTISGILLQGRVDDSGFQARVGFESSALVFEIEFMMEKGRVRIGNGTLSVELAKPSPYYEKFFSLLPDRSVRPYRKTRYFSGMVDNCVAYLDRKARLGSPLSEALRGMEWMETVMKAVGEHLQKNSAGDSVNEE